MKQVEKGISMSRRAFLGGTAAVAVMARRTALGSEANAKIKAGVIGLGGRGRMIAGMLQNHGGYHITAVADYFPDIAREVGQWLSVPEKTCFSGLAGYQRLLDSGVEAVFLETPPYCFPEHAAAAVAQGCHVFMAKPVACDVAGCMTVLDAGRRAGAANKVFLVDFQTRTDPHYQEGIARVARGTIGRVGLVSSAYTDESFADPPLTDTVESRLRHLIWVNDDGLGGGYLVNAGIHALDVALWVAGETPVSAVGASRIVRNDPHGNSHDVYSLTYHFKSGLIVNHRGEHLKNGHGFTCECVAYGQDGYLETSYSGSAQLHGGTEPYEGGVVVDLYPQGAIRNIETFHRSIMDGVYDNPTLEPSVNANLAAILGREAAARNTVMSWEEMMSENRKIVPDLSGLTV